MGAGGMYPSHPYPDDSMGYNYPYYNQGGYIPTDHIPPHGYPPNYPMGYGRGYPRPHPPMNNYGPMINGFHHPHGVFPNSMGGRGFFSLPLSGAGGLQSAPPSAAPNGNIQLNRPGNHRPGEYRPGGYRPHFDEQ